LALSTREWLIILGWVITIVGVYFAFTSRVKKIEESNDSLKKIVFLEKGGLNVVDNTTCKSLRNTVYSAIRRESGVTKAAFRNIDCLNQNIIKIMMHMKLKPIVFERSEKEREADKV